MQRAPPAICQPLVNRQRPAALPAPCAARGPALSPPGRLRRRGPFAPAATRPWPGLRAPPLFPPRAAARCLASGPAPPRSPGHGQGVPLCVGRVDAASVGCVVSEAGASRVDWRRSPPRLALPLENPSPQLTCTRASCAIALPRPGPSTQGSPCHAGHLYPSPPARTPPCPAPGRGGGGGVRGWPATSCRAAAALAGAGRGNEARRPPRARRVCPWPGVSQSRAVVAAEPGRGGPSDGAAGRGEALLWPGRLFLVGGGAGEGGRVGRAPQPRARRRPSARRREAG